MKRLVLSGLYRKTSEPTKGKSVGLTAPVCRAKLNGNSAGHIVQNVNLQGTIYSAHKPSGDNLCCT